MSKIFSSGIMVRCSDSPCHHTMMYYDPLKKSTNTDPPWQCDLCNSGRGPFIPKDARVGQQKQSKGK